MTTGAAAAGAAFFGPWKHLRVYAAASDKPLRIGASVDKTGVFEHSGAAELRGIRMAIAEANAGGGVLGRRVEDVAMDTRSSPESAPKAALDLIERENVAFMVGAIHSVIARKLSA
ncbi:MAG: ABC transporter substrate-binding protein, partial [Rhodospirillales bacterium]|nr:ABC transporter substrate-binding protein [Rhodospirillales bacterium]